MTTQLRAFRPLADTQTTAVGITNTEVTLNNTNGVRAIRVYNKGTEVVHIQFGGVATVASSMPIPSGQTEVFTIGNDITTFGVIAGVAGNTLYTTIGEGL